MDKRFSIRTSILVFGFSLGASAFGLQVIQDGWGIETLSGWVTLTAIGLLLTISGYFVGQKWTMSDSVKARRSTYFNRLSRREREVAELILDELSNKEIVDRIHIEPSTLKSHINRIYKKCETNSRSEFLKLFKLD